MTGRLSLLALVLALLGGVPEAWAAPAEDVPHETAPVEMPAPAEEIAEGEGDRESHIALVALAAVEPQTSGEHRWSAWVVPPPVPPPR